MKSIGKITMKEIEEIYFRLFPRLCVFAEKILKDSVVAKSVVQEVFLFICEKKDKLCINNSVEAYLFKAVYNRCLFYKRKTAIHQKHFNQIIYSQITDHIPDEIFDEEAIFKLKLLEKAINSLPEQCRKIFLLNKKEGLSYAKIAVLTGISVKTVDNHISKALKKIKEYIGNI